MERDKALLRILEHMPLPALIASPVTGKILWVNTRMLEMYGVDDPERLVGSTILDFIQAPQLGKALADLAKVVAGQSPPPVTYQLRRANGAYAAGQVSSVPLRFRGQVAMLSFVTDVTERESLLLSLSESEERYRLLLDTLPSGVVVVVDGVVKFGNRALAQALGLQSPDELLDTPMYDYIDEPYRKPVEEARRRMLVSGENHPAAPVVLVRVDGTRLETTASSAVIHWDGALATQTIFADVDWHSTNQKG